MWEESLSGTVQESTEERGAGLQEIIGGMSELPKGMVKLLADKGIKIAYESIITGIKSLIDSFFLHDSQIERPFTQSLPDFILSTMASVKLPKASPKTKR